jgi:hypothetical protein
LRVTPPDVIASARRHALVDDGPSTVPLTSIGPVPGSSENSKLRSVKLLSTRAVGVVCALRVLAEEEHLQADRPPAARTRHPFWWSD